MSFEFDQKKTNTFFSVNTDNKKEKPITITNNMDAQLAEAFAKLKNPPITKKVTIKGRTYEVKLHKVEPNDMPILLAKRYNVSLDTLRWYNSSENQEMLKQLGIYKPNNFSDKNEKSDQQYWVKEFGRAWNIDPDDLIVVDMIALAPEKKTQVQKPKVEAKKEKTREATDFENWIRENIDQNALKDLADVFGHEIGDLIEDGKYDEAEKILYKYSKKGYFPGGLKNPNHPAHKHLDDDPNKPKIFDKSTKYPGLYESSGGAHYYANDEGLQIVYPEDLQNGNWKKYVSKK